MDTKTSTADAQGPLVVKNDELSGPGNLVFDYNLEAWSKQPAIGEAYKVLARAAERIDDEQVSAFLTFNR